MRGTLLRFLQIVSKNHINLKSHNGFSHWVLAITAVLVVGLAFLISIGPGKHIRKKYTHQKLNLKSALPERIENIVRELTNTDHENRASVLEQYVKPTLTDSQKSGILNALEILSKSQEYHLYSVNRYGRGFVKVVFNCSDGNQIKRQIPFFLFEENNQLILLETP